MSGYCMLLWWRISIDLWHFANVFLSDEICQLFYDVLTIVFLLNERLSFVLWRFTILILSDNVCLLLYDVLTIVFLLDDFVYCSLTLCYWISVYCSILFWLLYILSDNVCLLLYDVLTMVFLFDGVCLLFFNALLLNFCLMTSVYCSILFWLLYILSDDACLLFYNISLL